ncbi:MAG TPA: nucleoside transporter C-terminal domain-containing protein [Candidatus Angelobacter sp.]|jgi:CNT family concentrative nucleoside transporter|nr:nucleoside transporter C-terminal domain-containing protein [Candidatus Angelobacter sp.]
MSRFAGLLGIIVFLSIAYLFSTNRRAIRMKTVLWGLGLQFLFAWIVIRFTWGQRTLQTAGTAVNKLLAYAFKGSTFVFGNLGYPADPNAHLPFLDPGSSQLGFIFAFQVLPTIIFISAFFALLYHLGVMQIIIKAMAWVMNRLMGVSGAESLNVAASIFMGQTEAPLTIRPLLPECTRSELMTIMTAGMAHVSGGIMAAYIGYGIKAENLLAAVIMTAPGTILMAKMLVPETEQPKTAGTVEISKEEMHKDANILGAIARGTIDGGQLAFNVAIMLISFLALIAMVNGIMGWTHNHFAFFPDSIQKVLGVIFAPVAWLIGVPGKDIGAVGGLLGTRTVINELVAYSDLGAMKAALDPRSVTIATFALCGFANFSSIGIQIGGIGALAPNKRDQLAKLGFRAMIAGTMANLMSASIVGLLMRS